MFVGETWWNHHFCWPFKLQVWLGFDPFVGSQPWRPKVCRSRRGTGLWRLMRLRCSEVSVEPVGHGSVAPFGRWCSDVPMVKNVWGYVDAGISTYDYIYKIISVYILCIYRIYIYINTPNIYIYNSFIFLRFVKISEQVRWLHKTIVRWWMVTGRHAILLQSQSSIHFNPRIGLGELLLAQQYSPRDKNKSSKVMITCWLRERLALDLDTVATPLW